MAPNHNGTVIVTGAMATAMAMTTMPTPNASARGVASTFKPVSSSQFKGDTSHKRDAQACAQQEPSTSATFSWPPRPVPSRSTMLTSPLNRLASRPASELIGARQSRVMTNSAARTTTKQPLTISSIPNQSQSARSQDGEVDEDGTSLLSLLFSPTLPSEHIDTAIPPPPPPQRTPPIRILPRTTTTSPTRTPPSPTSAARLADAVSMPRRCLPPRFPLRPEDSKAEFVIVNPAPLSVTDSGIDHSLSSSSSSSDQDALLSGPELTADCHAVTSPTLGQSVTKVEHDHGVELKLKRPRVKYLRKPGSVGQTDHQSKRVKKEPIDRGFYTPLRAPVVNNQGKSSAPIETPAGTSPPAQTLRVHAATEAAPVPKSDKGKDNATKGWGGTKKRRRSDPRAPSESDGNEASREASPDHPSLKNAVGVESGGPLKVRKTTTKRK